MDDYIEDSKGQSEDEFILSMFLTLASDFEPIEQAIAGMDPGVRSRMIEAGCIGEDTTTTSIEGVEISVGSSVEGAFEEPQELDYFLFQAEMGQRYLIEVTWDELPAVSAQVLNLSADSDLVTGSVSGSFDSESSPLARSWTAPKSGAFHIQVYAGEATGSYTFSVSINKRPDTPAGVSAAWEGSAIKVSWDPVESAEYYNVYYERTGGVCRPFDGEGTASSCDELAVNLVDTSYVHVSTSSFFPGSPNYYWVVACNSEGCSDIRSSNPTVPGDRPTPTSPTNQRSAALGAGDQVRITWDAVDGADHYRVYYNNHPSCSVDSSGSSSCEEVTHSRFGETDTGYTLVLDTIFDPLKDYFWVVACNSERVSGEEKCSEIDSENPATPAEN